MGIPLAVGDQVLVTANMLVCNQRCQVMQRYRVAATEAAYMVSDAMTDLIAQCRATAGWIKKLKNCLSTAVPVTEVWGQVIAPFRVRKTIVIDGDFGAEDEPQLTANTAASITKLTEAAADKRGISTMHVPIPNSDIMYDNGFITPGYKVSLQTIATALKLTLITPGPVATFIPVCNTSGLTAVGDLYDASVRDTVRVMRRRTVGLGI